MIENLIKQMRENSLRPKEEVSIKDLFKTICKSFALNKEILNQSLIEESGQELDMASIQNIFTRQSLNKYGNVNAPFINNYGRVSENMVPYGIVGVMIERKISLKNHLEIIKTCLETHNSLIIKPFFQSQTLTLFVTIINDVLKQTVDFNEIVLTDANLEKENIDLLIYIGDKTYFKKIDFKGEKIFLGIGQYELFVDEIIDGNRSNVAIAINLDDLIGNMAPIYTNRSFGVPGNKNSSIITISIVFSFLYNLLFSNFVFIFNIILLLNIIANII